MPEYHPLIASIAGNSALISFAIYMVIVFVLAGLANRQQKGRSFMNEYFLGSRNLGMWAFAFTYAATSASGGSFMGFPSLIYTHGWVLALWIGGYVVVPLVSIGLIAKRLNQVARKSGSITVPEMMRKRLGSTTVGNVGTILLIFFQFFFLLAQFKAGAMIMTTLLNDVEVFQQTASTIDRVTDPIPWIGQADGDVTNGGRRWHWSRVVKPTDDRRLLQIDLTVDGQPVGEVSSGAMSPSLGRAIGLCYLPRGRTKAGECFEVEIRGRRVPAQVVKTPFFKREK